jgi:hypothetical protein
MACKCNVGLGNTGTPSCEPIATVAKKLVVVPTYDDSGVKNSITIGDTLDDAYLTSKINAVDASQRWFPLPIMENVTQERADSITETSGSGKIAFIREGARSFFGEMWKQSPTFLGKLKEARCTDISVYVVDADGNVIGSCPSDDGKLYPIAVDKDSWDVKMGSATDSTVQKVTLGFNWSDSEKDEYVSMITEDDYTFDVLNSKGLLDVSSVNSNEALTGFTVNLNTAYGSKATPIKVKGLIITDFTLAELSPTPGAIVITSVTESADGVYDFVIPAATSADVLELTPSKDGYSFTAVIANTILIP